MGVRESCALDRLRALDRVRALDWLRAVYRCRAVDRPGTIHGRGFVGESGVSWTPIEQHAAEESCHQQHPDQRAGEKAGHQPQPDARRCAGGSPHRSKITTVPLRTKVATFSASQLVRRTQPCEVTWPTWLGSEVP